MRSLLLVCPDDIGRCDAALASGADALVVALRHAPPASREAARGAARAFLLRAAALPRHPRLVAEIDALASGNADADLEAVMASAPDAIMLPGAVGAVDIQHLAAKLAVHEAENGIASGRTGILAMVADTARGVLALGTIPAASPRLLALAWDPRGLAREITAGEAAGGAVARTAEPCRMARGLIVVAAVAAGVAVIDAVTVGDEAKLTRDSRAARRDGFTGKLALDAAQVPTIARCFAADRRR
jgi:citrate lyase subunit beta/citryl-CoA lyase